MLSRANDLRIRLAQLSTGQLKLLTLISSGKKNLLTGKASQKTLDLSGATITNALNTLIEQDYLEKEMACQFSVIDPLISYYLAHYEHSNLE